MQSPRPLAQKQAAAYFTAFTEALVVKYKPLLLYCFGKNSYKANGVAHKPTSQYQYFLLMITETNTRIEHQVQDYANSHYPCGSIVLLAHSLQTLSNGLKTNNRFFINVCQQGQLLYHRNDLLQLPQVTAYNTAQATLKAQKHYQYRLPLAMGFLNGAKECQARALYQIAVFMLHQVVEQCCIILIMVHLGYRSDMHNLKRLLHLCNCFSVEPTNLFLATEADQQLFGLMVSSYSASRYKDDFIIQQPMPSACCYW